MHDAEEPILRKKLRRKEMMEFFEKLPPTVIAIEACGGSHQSDAQIGTAGAPAGASLHARTFAKTWPSGAGARDDAESDFPGRRMVFGRQAKPGGKIARVAWKLMSESKLASFFASLESNFPPQKES
jgi:hypothetical protein